MGQFANLCPWIPQPVQYPGKPLPNVKQFAAECPSNPHVLQCFLKIVGGLIPGGELPFEDPFPNPNSDFPPPLFPLTGPKPPLPPNWDPLLGPKLPLFP